MTSSALYTGTVRHRRFGNGRAGDPDHAFTYRVYYPLIDLDELPALLDGTAGWSARSTGPAIARFRRRDLLGDAALPLGTAVRDEVESATGRRPLGAVRMLAHPAYLGVSFNPIALYYCFDLRDRFTAVVAEVTNTPWGERTRYTLEPPTPGGTIRGSTPKQLHVSPFLPMGLTHHWTVTPPGDRLVAHIEDRPSGDPSAPPRFDATLSLRRGALTPRALQRALVTYPPMTATVVGGIYLQALRLWRKGATFHSHPDRRPERNDRDHASQPAA